MIIDCNAFVGMWPFRKTRFGNVSELLRLHRENQIDGGLVSSLQAIFYHDPWEAEAELFDMLRDLPNYQQVFTVNPRLPSWRAELARAVREFSICGVRIVPGYHGYTLDDPEVGALCAQMRDYGLPLFLTMHIIDERTAYLMQPRALSEVEVIEFLKHCGLRVMLTGARSGELRTIWMKFRDFWFEMSGLKDELFVVEKLHRDGLTARMKFGTETPILCMKSTKLLLDYAEIPAAQKKQIAASWEP